MPGKGLMKQLVAFINCCSCFSKEIFASWQYMPWSVNALWKVMSKGIGSVKIKLSVKHNKLCNITFPIWVTALVNHKCISVCNEIIRFHLLSEKKEEKMNKKV